MQSHKSAAVTGSAIASACTIGITICPKSQYRPVRASASRFARTRWRTTSPFTARFEFMGTNMHGDPCLNALYVAKPV